MPSVCISGVAQKDGVLVWFCAESEQNGVVFMAGEDFDRAKQSPLLSMATQHELLALQTGLTGGRWITPG